MKIRLRPGTPDDANREYLPERIRGSDIVVNDATNKTDLRIGSSPEDR